MGALANLEAFASHNGARFYGLPLNTESVGLVKRPWTVPASYPFGTAEVVPLKAGQQIAWSLEE